MFSSCDTSNQGSGLVMSPPTPSSSQAYLQHTLCFVLQHSDLCHNIKALCSLLSVSTSCASSVLASCAGCVTLTVATGYCSSARLSGELIAAKPGSLQWLAKHAVLLRHLQHRVGCRTDLQTASQGLAAAVGAAASLPEGLRLQSLSTNSMALLAAAASCSSLTKLQLQLDPDDLGLGHASGTSVNPSSAKQKAVAAVTGLACNLRTLQLSAASQWRSYPSLSKDGWFDSFVQQALPMLKALTRLDIEGLHDICVLNHAPAQLVELECNSTKDNTDKALVLGHLSACTALTLDSRFMALGGRRPCRRVIKAGDTLPPSLQRLCVIDCKCTTPLLPLSQLTELSMSRSSTRASDLSRLSVLTNLQKVALWYLSGHHAGYEADRAAAGWASVPGLQELVLDGQLLDPLQDSLECLGKLSELTRLVWSSSYVHFDTPPDGVLPNGLAHLDDQAPVFLRDAGLHRLAAALRGTTSLRELIVDQFLIDQGRDEDGWVIPVDEPAVLVGFKALMQAVHALPYLRSHTVQDDRCGWLPAGNALFDRIQAGEDVDSDELEHYSVDFWVNEEPVYVDDSGDGVWSDDVSVELMAADPVSEEYGGGVYDDDDYAVWEGDEDG